VDKKEKINKNITPPPTGTPLEKGRVEKGKLQNKNIIVQ